ncbi:acyltransferase [Oscillospiraceae bacterium LCP25S3_E10]|nr:UDP-N-acetylglucosamine pyrophosphorylase [Ruminococcus sp.]MDD6447575.1 UDP-N-acetylglucosamine pyrophosphorylase [Ruminococcus sp.]MDY2857126.1 UDP-N-acetylglucosamine pyrophosphorylase [Oscillospiraceae bacterium]
MSSKLETKALLDCTHTIAAPLFEDTTYPWEVLDKIEKFIMEIGPTLPPEKYDQIGDNIWIAKTANVAPSAMLNGPLIICERAEVRHCAFIRGKAIIGEGSVVGNSTEVKNSILFDNVQAPHFNYVGDSIYGYKSHTGAGVIASNLKSDKTNVVINVDNQKIDTGLKKLGAIIGDYVEVGCNSVLNPGTVVGRHTTVYPVSRVRGYVAEDSIYKQADDIVEKFLPDVE